MVGNLPSSAGGVGLISGYGAGLLHVSRPQNQKTNNRDNIVTNSVGTLKQSTSKKFFKTDFLFNVGFQGKECIFWNDFHIMVVRQTNNGPWTKSVLLSRFFFGGGGGCLFLQPMK